MIANGNDDVYNSEKEKNRQYKNQLINDGLDTSKVDLWDTTIDQAYFKATDPRRVTDKGQPKFMSYRMSMLTNQLNRHIDELTKNANESRNKARQNAIDDRNTLKEWLANNGYSQNGSYAKKEFSNITKTLSSTLKKISDDYVRAVNLARQSYLNEAKR